MSIVRPATKLLGPLLQRRTLSNLSPSVSTLVGGRNRHSERDDRRLKRFCSDTIKPQAKQKHVNITFIDRDGEEHSVQAKIGDTLLEVAKQYDIDLEGACEGTLACSTCHLIVDEEWYNKIPDPVTDEEQDMLDLAYGLTDTSRLGCQIIVSKEIENIRLKVPEGTSDAREL